MRRALWSTAEDLSKIASFAGLAAGLSEINLAKITLEAALAPKRIDVRMLGQGVIRLGSRAPPIRRA